jgi:hypothetical protein
MGTKPRTKATKIIQRVWTGGTPEAVVGIDPGLHGALVLYRPNPPAVLLSEGGVVGGTEPHLMVWDIPKAKVQKTLSKAMLEFDKQGIFDLARALVDVYGAQRVIIENVSGRAGQGSGFSFGFGVGLLHMAFVAAGAKPETVTPSVWKRDAKVPADKDKTTACADETFPDYKHLFRVPYKNTPTKIVTRHDRAEAALIAWWGVHHV